MLKALFLSAIRNLHKQKSYFLINTGGLAIGITCFALISLHIHSELSYDKFHTDSADLYRVQMRSRMNGQYNDRSTTVAPMAKALITEYPEVLNITRVRKSGEWFMSRGEKKFNESNVLFADSTFFEVFDYQFIAGDPQHALKHPRSVVLTRSAAEKYFDNEDPMGKVIDVEHDGEFYTVTGVIENVPTLSHMSFDMMGSISSLRHWNSNRWVNHNMHTYLTLRPSAEPKAFEEKIQGLIPKYVGPAIEEYYGLTLQEWKDKGNLFEYYLMPLEDIHLHSHSSLELETNGDIRFLYIYIVIALVILFVAIINYINLATAQSLTRAKEVGIRKIVGSTKTKIVTQFLTESLLTALLATLAAILFIYLLTPYFSELINSGHVYSIFSSAWQVVFLILLGAFTGLAAGFYPSLVLSSFRPIEVLKGRFKSSNKSSYSLRNLLVILQLTTSIIIIIGTVVIYRQTDFLLSKDLGFDQEQILVVRRSDVLLDKLELYKELISKHPNIASVAHARSIPGKDRYRRDSYMSPEIPGTPFILNSNRVSFGYAELMGFELIEGRFFDPSLSTDSTAVIINEAAVSTIGLIDPIGKKLISKNIYGDPLHAEIIGVVKDYHIKSLHEYIEPTVLKIMPENWEGFLTIKCQHVNQVTETLKFIEDKWLEHTDGKPFEYFFLDEDFSKLYNSESATARFFLVFSGLSIFITCLGLIGLITYTVSIRRKEIGTRKVLGASSFMIMKLLSNDMFRLITIASLLAWPMAYFATNRWLENFVDRLNVSPVIYVLSTLVVGGIGGIAISFHTIKASLQNPVESLRQE